MAIQTQLVVSLVKNNEDYLGKVSKLCHGAPGDGRRALVPNAGQGQEDRVFCMVVSRPYDMDRLVDKVCRFLAAGS